MRSAYQISIRLGAVHPELFGFERLRVVARSTRRAVMLLSGVLRIRLKQTFEVQHFGIINKVEIYFCISKIAALGALAYCKNFRLIGNLFGAIW